MGTLAGGASHRRLRRASLPPLRERRLRRRQGERVPHPASRRGGYGRSRFAPRAMIRVIAYAVFAAMPAAAYALQASDDRGVTMSLARPASRIVTLAPHLAEIAFAAGAGAKLAGVSSFSRHPAEAQRLPVVASYGRVDIERLIALRPDLVLAWRSGNSPLQIDRLERIGIRVFVTEARRLADIPRIVRLVGAVAGSAEVAEARARQFENEVADLRKRYAAERRVAVFLEIWHTPLLTVNGAHLISDALRLCGGHNVFAAAKTLTPLVSPEQILDAQPRAILTGGLRSEALQAGEGVETVPAGRNKRIFAVDPGWLHAHGAPRLRGVRALCERLAPAPARGCTPNGCTPAARRSGPSAGSASRSIPITAIRSLRNGACSKARGCGP